MSIHESNESESTFEKMYYCFAVLFPVLLLYFLTFMFSFFNVNLFCVCGCVCVTSVCVLHPCVSLVSISEAVTRESQKGRAVAGLSAPPHLFDLLSDYFEHLLLLVV